MDLDIQLIDGFRQRLRWKIIYHLGRYCPDVDDVLQETLARFLIAVRDEKVQHPDRIGAFLSGICNNVISEYRRRLMRDTPYDFTDHEPTASVESEAEQIDRQQTIAVTLAALSERDNEILRTFYLLGKDKAEICAQLELSDAQFRVALFRAKGRFRRAYDQNLKQRHTGSH